MGLLNYLKDMLDVDDEEDEIEEQEEASEEIEEKEHTKKEKKPLHRTDKHQDDEQPKKKGLNVVMVKPFIIEDTKNIIRLLCEGNAVILDVSDLEVGLRRRVVDIITGARAALGYSMKNTDKSYNNYFIAPTGVTILKENENDDYSENSFEI